MTFELIHNENLVQGQRSKFTIKFKVREPGNEASLDVWKKYNLPLHRTHFDYIMLYRPYLQHCGDQKREYTTCQL